MIFLSHILTNSTPLYGNREKNKITKNSQILKGDTANSSNINIPSHSGTHIDAPFHFDEEGKSLSDYSAMYWKCESPYLINLAIQKDEIITLEKLKLYLERMPASTDILLIKTGFEKYRNNKDIYIFHNPGISPEIGIWLRNNSNIKFIGFDFISITSYQNRELGKKSHSAFLANLVPDKDKLINQPPILIIEDMKLSEISFSPKKVILAPLIFEKADGAPVTVFAE